MPWPHAALRLSPSSQHGVDLGLRGEPVTTLLESSSSDREANEISCETKGKKLTEGDGKKSLLLVSTASRRGILLINRMLVFSQQ